MLAEAVAAHVPAGISVEKAEDILDAPLFPGEAVAEDIRKEKGDTRGNRLNTVEDFRGKLRVVEDTVGGSMDKVGSLVVVPDPVGEAPRQHEGRWWLARRHLQAL